MPADSAGRRRNVRKTRPRTLWRLELGCGHTAFGLAAEPHREGLARVCYPCGGYAHIVSSTAIAFSIPYSERRRPLEVETEAPEILAVS